MGIFRGGAKSKRAPRIKPTAQGPLRGRLAFVALVLMGGFGVVALQLIHLQVLDAPRLSARADQQHHTTIRLAGERGTITDRNGDILAKNMSVPSISANPARIPDPVRAARELARVLPVSARALQKRLAAGGRHFAWVDRQIDPALARKVMELELPGIYEVPESRRFYPNGKLLGHILGFSGIDNQGLSGVEQAFDAQLRGRETVFTMERDALGRAIFPSDSVYAQPGRGADLVLTIDETIQYHVERELDRAMEATHAASGSVVVLQPYTGEVLAMAVRPEFDPNRAGRYGADDFRNRILTDPYEPGSTMKVFLAAAVLEAGLVSLDELIDCENGYLPLRGGAMRDTHPHGEIPFAEVLSKSSNIGSTKVAMRLGEDRLYRAYTRFGFGQRTGIDLGGESPGLLLPTERWSARSLPSLAIGQEMAVTPIQMAVAAAAVANGGWIMRPYLVREVHVGDEVTRTRPRRLRRVLSGPTAARLREALVAVTEEGGTAPRAAVPGYRVAGKTGTAQKAAVGRRGYAPGKYVASFLGMVPAESPRLVILVVIDEPQGKHFGGTVAAPVFREIVRPVLAYLGEHPRTERVVMLADASR